MQSRAPPKLSMNVTEISTGGSFAERPLSITVVVAIRPMAPGSSA
jgi:hypothetical protein